jgi:hypothetical protein
VNCTWSEYLCVLARVGRRAYFSVPYMYGCVLCAVVLFTRAIFLSLKGPAHIHFLSHCLFSLGLHEIRRVYAVCSAIFSHFLLVSRNGFMQMWLTTCQVFKLLNPSSRIRDRFHAFFKHRRSFPNLHEILIAISNLIAYVAGTANSFPMALGLRREIRQRTEMILL